MNRDDFIKHIAALREWDGAKIAGKARAAAMQAVASSGIAPTDPVLTLPFGDLNAVITATGEFRRMRELTRTIARLERIEKPTDDDIENLRVADAFVSQSDRIGWHPAIKSKFTVPRGAAPVNKMIGDMKVACGLVLILGGGGVGKTPLAHALACYDGVDSKGLTKYRDYATVRFGEPLAGYEHDVEIAAAQVGLALMQHSDVVLDSVKDIMAMASGAAMKSGIIRSSLPMFTRWSTIAADIGSTLYVPLNPSSKDEEVIALLEEAATSNSMSMIIATGKNSWKYLTRGGEGLERRMGDFSTSFDANGAMVLGKREQSRATTGPTVTGTIGDELISATIRRSLQAQVNFSN